MKSKLITKALLLTLSLILALSVFASCAASKEEFETFKGHVDELESKVDDNTITIETLETKEVVAQLKALADSIKVTADAAATQTALTDAIAALEAADSTKATAEALAAAKTALEAAIAANADADAATKASIESALAAVKATADAAATAAALEEAKAEIAEQIGTLDASVIAGFADAKATIGEIVVKLDKNAEADAAAKAELEEAIATVDASVISGFADAKKTIGDIIVALDANTELDAATKAELIEMIETLSADTIKGFADAKKSVGDVITDLDALEENVGKLEADTIKGFADAKDTFGKIVNDLAANSELDAATKAELEEMIAGVDANVIAGFADAKKSFGNMQTQIDAIVEANAAAKEELIEMIENLRADTVNSFKDAKDSLGLVAVDLDKLAEEVANNNTSTIQGFKDAKDTIGGIELRIDSLVEEVANNNAAAIQGFKDAKDTIGNIAVDLDNLTTEVINNNTTTIQSFKDAKDTVGKLEVRVNTLEEDLGKLIGDVSKGFADAKADFGIINTTIDDMKEQIGKLEADTIKGFTDARNTIGDIQNEIAGIKTTVSALDAAYKAADEAFEVRIAKLEADYTTLNDKVTSNTTNIAANKTEIDAINAELVTLKETITKLSEYDSAFIADYNEATQILDGAIKYIETVENADGTTSQIEHDYSIDAFKAKNVVDTQAKFFIESELNEYIAVYQRLEFFLGRALSGDQIHSYFKALDEAYNKMTPLLKILDNELNDVIKNKEINTTNAWEEALALFTEYYNNLTSAGVFNDDHAFDTKADEKHGLNAEFAAATAEKYALIVDADENLDKAEAAGATINNNIVDLIDEEKNEYIVLGTHDQAVADYLAAYKTLVDTYFVGTPDKEATDDEPAVPGTATTIAKYVALYSESVYTAEKKVVATALVANYNDLVAYDARLTVLKEAQASAIALITTNYVDENEVAVSRPLYTEATGLTTNLTAVNAHIVKYVMATEAEGAVKVTEPLNVAAIYGVGKYENLVLAEAYAVAMNTIYTTHDLTYSEVNGVAQLVADVNAIATKAKADTLLHAKETVLYTDGAAIKAYRANIIAVEDKIKAVENYADVDKNYDEMIVKAIADNNAKFVALEERIAELDAAYNELTTLRDDWNAYTADLDSSTPRYISPIPNNLVDLCKKYDLAWVGSVDESKDYKTDANYNELFVESGVITAYEDLVERYETAYADVFAVYTFITEYQKGNKVTLADGTTMYNNDMIVAKLTKLGTNVDVLVNANIEGKNQSYFQTSALANTWGDILEVYVALAVEAENAAAPIIDAINALKNDKVDVDAADLNNYTAIEAAYTAYAAWIKTYITDAEITLAAAQGHMSFHGNGQIYQYITPALEDVLMNAETGKWTIADKTYKEAMAVWEGETGLKATLENLTKIRSEYANDGNGEWNIHKDYATPAASFKSYVETYYNNDESTITTSANGEAAVYADFAAQKVVHDTAVAKAKIDAALINANIVGREEDNTVEPAITAIAALDFVAIQLNADNSAHDAIVSNIRGLIADYKSNYNCDILECTDCLAESSALAFLRYEAKVEYTAVANNVLTTYATELAAGQHVNGLGVAITAGSISGEWASTNNAIGVVNGTTAEAIESAKNSFIANLDSYAAILAQPVVTP